MQMSRLPWSPRRRGGPSLRRWETYGRPSVPQRGLHCCSSCSLAHPLPSQYLQSRCLWSCCQRGWMTLLGSWRWWNEQRRHRAVSVRKLGWREPHRLCRCCCRSGNRIVDWQAKRNGEPFNNAHFLGKKNANQLLLPWQYHNIIIHQSTMTNINMSSVIVPHILQIWRNGWSCSHFVWNHDIWEDQGWWHVHSFLVFWFVSFPFLVFLQIDKKNKTDQWSWFNYTKPILIFASFYSFRSLRERNECEDIPHHRKCWVKERKCQKQAKGLIRTQEQKRDNVHGWAKQRALHFKGSVQDESLDIHKQKESDGRKIKRTECC